MIDTEIAVTRQTICQIRPLLAGLPPYLQGAVLSELLALWLAGHYAPDNPEDTAQFRADLLEMHIRLVKQLIPKIAQEIGTTV